MNALAHIRKLAMPLLVFSFVTNLAVLISPLFMMQVLDRVVPSGNIATLLLLGLLAMGALLLQSATEVSRDISLGRLSRWCEDFGANLALASGRKDAQETVLRVSAVVSFLGGPGILAALNIPWIPVFCLVLAFIHPAFVALLGGLILLSLGARFTGGLLTRSDRRAVQNLTREQGNCLKNAKLFESETGMAIFAHRLRNQFIALQSRRHSALSRQHATQSWATGIAGFLRSGGQILALALGAFLVTQNQLSAGGMIAASIILAKGFASVEGAAAQLPALRAAHSAYRTLCQEPTQSDPQNMDVGELSGRMRSDGLTVPKGQGAPPRLDRVSFDLKAGECLAIVGGSGAGKTTLLKALSGLDCAPIGAVFLDQSEIKSLGQNDLCNIIGYLPQQAGLVPGTVAQNIAAFAPDAQDSQIIEASRSAGVHGLISALPNGYNTDLTGQMHLLSAGQRQRVALARAIFHKPKYLFLDEPNALLDADGEKTLAQTLFRLKEGSTTIVMVLHRSGIMGLADKVLRLDRGRMVDFGARAEVLGRLGMGGRRVELPVLESSVDDLRDWVASQFTRASDADFARKAQSVASELFFIACQSEPRNAPRIASFVFTFVDDTHCEISMVEDLPNEVETMVARVRAKLGNAKGFVSDLTQDELAVDRIMKESERFQVRSTEEATHFTVSLTHAAPETTLTKERLN